MTQLLSTSDTMLLVIDVQEKLTPLMFNRGAMVRAAQNLIRGCALLDIPVIVSEQYPQGLGGTIPELKSVLPASAVVLAKQHFGCCDEPPIETHLQATDRKQIMVCGIEAHICVNQTVVCLLESGYSVFLIEDAIGTRQETNYQIGLKKMAQMGAVPCCVEMALFELMRTSRHPSFKAIQQIIK